MRLFVYGELCRAAVLRRVLGRLPCAGPAVLADHSRRPRPETGHFAIGPAPGAQVAGTLLEDLTAGDMAKLDAYEDVAAGLYARVPVRVRALASDGEDVDACTYVGGRPVHGA